MDPWLRRRNEGVAAMVAPHLRTEANIKKGFRTAEAWVSFLMGRPFLFAPLGRFCYLWCLLVVAWATMASAVAQGATALDQQTSRKIDALVAIAMAHQHVPALSLAIAKDGQILYARGYGYRDVTSGRSASAKTFTMLDR